jgi:hypothetical protein
MKLMKHFSLPIFCFLLFLITTLQSCSSFLYTENQRLKNNSFIVTSNYPYYKVTYTKEKETSVNLTGNTVHLRSLKRKYTFLTFSNEECYDINVHIRRKPRMSTIIKGLPFYFYLAPLAIDVFKSDFYKISRRSKNIYLQFQKTNEYFQKNIKIAIWDLNYKLLDKLLLENPSKEIVDEIVKSKKTISNKILYDDIKNIITENSLENYNFLEKKYKDRIYEYNNIFDSIKIAVQTKEISNIRKEKNLLRLYELIRISDSKFIKELIELESEIEETVFQNIIDEYNIKKINQLHIVSDKSRQDKLNQIQEKIEFNLIEDLKSDNPNLKLSEELRTLVSEKTRNNCDSLRQIIEKKNIDLKLKNSIEVIEKEIKKENYKLALETINKIYPNQYKQNQAENIKLEELLNIATNADFIKAYREKLYNNLTLNQSDFDNFFAAFQGIKKYSQLNKLQKSDLEKLYSQWVDKQIEYYYNQKNEISSEKLNSFLYKHEISLALTQKEKINSLIISCKKRDALIKKQEEEIRKQEEIANKKREMEVAVAKEKRRKEEELERKRLNSGNSEHTNSNNQKKSPELELCTTESGYDYIRNTKMSFYEGGLVEISLDNGGFKYGRFSTYNGSVIINVRGFPSIVLEPAYGNNFIDRHGHEWRPCWY